MHNCGNATRYDKARDRNFRRPPCCNLKAIPAAAQEHSKRFHDAVLDDQAIGALIAIPADAEHQTDDQCALYSIFKNVLWARALVAFNDNNNHQDNWTDNLKLAWQARQIAVDVVKLCSDIFAIVYGGEAEFPQLIAKITQDITDLTNDVNNKDIGLSGVYPNGYLAPAMRDVALIGERELTRA